VLGVLDREDFVDGQHGRDHALAGSSRVAFRKFLRRIDASAGER
jgi:hypothetical protein